MFYRYGQCSLSGCDRPKHKRGRYCQQHRKRLAAYGHPHGRPVVPSELIPWAIKARRILDKNVANHDGIKLAMDELTRVLSEAVDRDERIPRHSSSPRSRAAVDRKVVANFARLSRQGVTALDILTMVSAVALLDQSEARRFLDQASYQYAVARAVLGIVPRPGGRPFGANTLATVGKYLTDQYAALAGVVVRAVLAQEDHGATRRAAMMAPIHS